MRGVYTVCGTPAPCVGVTSRFRTPSHLKPNGRRSLTPAILSSITSHALARIRTGMPCGAAPSKRREWRGIERRDD